MRGEVALRSSFVQQVAHGEDLFVVVGPLHHLRVGGTAAKDSMPEFEVTLPPVWGPPNEGEDP